MPSHLSAFSLQALAQISDWLDEQGELPVRITNYGHYHYLVRSMRDLKRLVSEQDQQPVFEIYREPAFSMTGVVDELFVEHALQRFAHENAFSAMALFYYPDSLEFIAYQNGEGIKSLLEVLAMAWGQRVALLIPELVDDADEDEPDISRDDIVRIDPLDPRTHRTTYVPYDADPARYQWILDLWKI